MRRRARLFAYGLAMGVLLAGTGFGLRDGPPAARLAAAGAIGPDVEGLVAAHAPDVATAPAAQPDVDALPTPREAPAAAAFAEMKHVWQSLNNCGPAAVVMALSTLGVDVDQETARLALRGTDPRRGMGPTPVGPWVGQHSGLKMFWRNNGTNDLIKRLVANGFAPMVTQWMQDPSISRVAHWRTVRGYDDARGVFYVNDSMLGSSVALDYGWFGKHWQSFSYRYMVLYRPNDEKLLRAIIGRDWNEGVARHAMYERAREEALAHDTNFAWLAYGEAAYANGMFEEAVAAFDKGFKMGSATGVFGIRNSYPNALRALGRRDEADAVARAISGVTSVPATVAPAPDSYAVFLALRRMTPYEALPTP